MSHAFLKTTLAMVIVITALFAGNASAIEPDNAPDSPLFSMKGASVKEAIESLGHKVQEHTDAHGNPHFVFETEPGTIKDIAVYMLDCGTVGCVDIVLYADFGVAEELTLMDLNNWNHIGSMTRSKAFRSNEGNADDPVGLSTSISYLGESDEDRQKLAMQIGLFLVETGAFSTFLTTIGK